LQNKKAIIIPRKEKYIVKHLKKHLVKIFLWNIEIIKETKSTMTGCHKNN